VNRFERVTSWQRVLILLIGIVACACWVAAMAHDLSYFFVASGVSILLICLLPIFVMKTYDWFCPWTALILSVIYGCTLPAVCMTFNLPDEQFVSENILLHQPVEHFVMPTLLLMSSFVCIGIGYFGFPSKDRYINIPRVAAPQRLLMICLLCGAIAFLAFAAYFVLNGGIARGLSTKRGTINTLDVAEDAGFSQYGYLRQFAKFGNVALLLLAAFWARNKVKAGTGIAFIQMGIIGGLLLLSIAFPFYSSSRAGIVWVVIGFIGVLYYMDQKILSFKAITVTGAIAVLVIAATVLRNDGAENQFSVSDRLGRLMLNRHGPDIAVTSHVVQGLPHKLEYKYGETIAVWLIAPVPRELMPSKPLIHSGPIIGQQIYQLPVSGVPPGLAAELYWNFHVLGVIFGSILFGVFMKLTYQTCRNFKMDPVLLVPIYIYAVFPIGFKATTHSIGPAVIMPIVELVTVCLVVYFVSVGTNSAPIQAQPIPTLGDSRAA